ncbi:MAG: efflux transporter outer membrane subunit [Acidobacteriaceae bacterium]|nr:efflux transporter outer membrane subunit [Acidobacteriaceae bacterium]
MRSKTLHEKLSVASVAIVLAIVTACNPAPKYAKPPAPTPQAFKEAIPQEYKEGQGWKLATPDDDKIRGNWWEVYNDPQLNALEEQVALSNQSLKVSEANFRAARALVANVRSGLFPLVGAGASYSNSRISATARNAIVTGGSSTPGGTTTGAAGGGSSPVVNTFSVPFDVSYEVDLWHRVRNMIAANSFQAQASAADIATSQLSLQSQLAQDYFQVRALDTQRQILTDTVENYRKALALNQVLFRGGIASDEEVSQAQTQLDTATAELTDLGVARAQYEHAIATLIGKPAATFELSVGEFVPRPPGIPVALPSELLERRPDIAAAERQVAAANAEIGVAKAAYYPTLSLSASAGFQTAHALEWFNWPSRFWSVGTTMSQTVFDGGLRRAQVAQAQASYEGTVANYRQTVLTAFQGVEDQLAALRILSNEIEQQHTAVASANHYLDLSLTRYRAGVDSYLNVIAAQNAVLTNRVTELQIELRQMVASVSLVMDLGGGWDPSRLPTVHDVTHISKAVPDQGSVKAQAVAAPNPPPLPAPAK